MVPRRKLKLAVPCMEGEGEVEKEKVRHIHCSEWLSGWAMKEGWME